MKIKLCSMEIRLNVFTVVTLKVGFECEAYEVNNRIG